MCLPTLRDERSNHMLLKTQDLSMISRNDASLENGIANDRIDPDLSRIDNAEDIGVSYTKYSLLSAWSLARSRKCFFRKAALLRIVLLCFFVAMAVALRVQTLMFRREMENFNIGIIEITRNAERRKSIRRKRINPQ
mmetsp:Transcript_12161/g.18377  ORF Transcript_12161/g.18377 Transcript_12161/m.18377 type:complete len:137 (-) Transcript_12161:1618-2028(-)